MIVGVIGTGTMGRELYLRSLRLKVTKCAYAAEKKRVQGAEKKKIAQALEKRVGKGKITKEKAEEILGKIKTGTNEICERADLVIESVREDMETKKICSGNWKKICPEDCIFGNKHLRFVNYGDGTGAGPPGYRHAFFNPAEVMKLVEVVEAMNTPKSLTVRVKEIAESIKKYRFRWKNLRVLW